ncbi:hypothetical protein [Sphingomonas morindae]|uniref:PAS domain-containing protein n=1 Tax=Sphingomonas morindae TaxID=1541170 RepID=A0ABY4XB69_9SPHN|nr:hypothetical protein [Sphingomonas morindae]USI74129.1 hypothetical protein LHA26_06615 [Sphingomonas morindae]
MDEARTIRADPGDEDGEFSTPRIETGPPPRERRLQVRAFEHWAALLRGRAMPAAVDLGPAADLPFADHAVLLRFDEDYADPALTHLGSALAAEAGLKPGAARRLADVPGRSLLSRLTDHRLECVAHRAPIGFEAEFVGRRGLPTLYRGILLPLSEDGEAIDGVLGVISWKELAAPALTEALRRDLAQALAMPSAPPSPAPTLAAQLAAARAGAGEAQRGRLKTRAALYRALGLAYDFARASEKRPEEYGALLAEAGIRRQTRAPMTAVAKLVFGADADKARLTEFAAALAQARRRGLEPGGFVAAVESEPGGLKGLVAAERVARRPADAPPSLDQRARAALHKLPALARLEIAGTQGEFVLLIARREADGRLAVVAPIPDESPLVARAIRKISR